MLVKNDPSARPTIPMELPFALHLEGNISEGYAKGAHTISISGRLRQVL